MLEDISQKTNGFPLNGCFSNPNGSILGPSVIELVFHLLYYKLKNMLSRFSSGSGNPRTKNKNQLSIYIYQWYLYLRRPPRIYT